MSKIKILKSFSWLANGGAKMVFEFVFILKLII